MALAVTLKVTISGLVVSYLIAYVDGFIIIGLVPDGVAPPTYTFETSTPLYVQEASEVNEE